MAEYKVKHTKPQLRLLEVSQFWFAEIEDFWLQDDSYCLVLKSDLGIRYVKNELHSPCNLVNLNLCSLKQVFQVYIVMLLRHSTLFF